MDTQKVASVVVEPCEPVTVVSHIKGGCVVSIKDARYNMDTDLAKAISI